jgi:hypothetical protein
MSLAVLQGISAAIVGPDTQAIATTATEQKHLTKIFMKQSSISYDLDRGRFAFAGTLFSLPATVLR